MLYTWIKNYLHERYLQRKAIDESIQRWKEWEQKLDEDVMKMDTYKYTPEELEAYYEECYNDNPDMYKE